MSVHALKFSLLKKNPYVGTYFKFTNISYSNNLLLPTNNGNVGYFKHNIKIDDNYFSKKI